MTKQPAYFDSQASAAAALKIDIYDLREAKRQRMRGISQRSRVHRFAPRVVRQKANAKSV
jgi:hypothetical protein